MPIKQVVVDASPLITLYKSQLANLLPQLFAQVQVPPAVWQEVTAAKDDISAQSLPQSNWVIRTEAIALNPPCIRLGLRRRRIRSTQLRPNPSQYNRHDR